MYSVFKPFPKLNTKRLLLRLNNLKDAKDIFEIYGNKTVCDCSDLNIQTSINDAKRYVNNNLKNYHLNKCYTFVVELKAENKVIGTVSIIETTYNYKIISIGYSFNPNYHNKGYATEALEVFLDFCFNTLKTERVEAKVLLNNEPSIKLLKKLGFNKDALLKKGALYKNGTVDVFLFSKTA